MEISFIRIDDRLIHGQVATVWSKELGINRVIACNDVIAKDDLRKQLLIKLAPPRIKAYVISIAKTIEICNDSKFDSSKTLFLFTNPTDVLRIYEGGIHIKSVNVGGMSYKDGKKQITSSISVDQIDIEAFKRLNEYGIELEVRQLVKDNKVILMNKLKELNFI